MTRQSVRKNFFMAVRFHPAWMSVELFRRLPGWAEARSQTDLTEAHSGWWRRGMSSCVDRCSGEDPFECLSQETGFHQCSLRASMLWEDYEFRARRAAVPYIRPSG